MTEETSRAPHPSSSRDNRLIMLQRGVPRYEVAPRRPSRSDAVPPHLHGRIGRRYPVPPRGLLNIKRRPEPTAAPVDDRLRYARCFAPRWPGTERIPEGPANLGYDAVIVHGPHHTEAEPYFTSAVSFVHAHNARETRIPGAQIVGQRWPVPAKQDQNACDGEHEGRISFGCGHCRMSPVRMDEFPLLPPREPGDRRTAVIGGPARRLICRPRAFMDSSPWRPFLPNRE